MLILEKKWITVFDISANFPDKMLFILLHKYLNLYKS
jgi:hypothetical protein